MSSEDDIEDKKIEPPEHAFRAPIAYNSATDKEPREIEYGTYRKLGLIKNNGQHFAAALAEARKKYGYKANVLETARWFVAYIIE